MGDILIHYVWVLADEKKKQAHMCYLSVWLLSHTYWHPH